LFGFAEGDLDTPIWIAIASEAAAVLLLAPVAVANFMRGASARGGPRGALTS